MAYKNFNNKVSTTNSTTTNLGANATFTGAWEDALYLTNIRVSVTAGVASATNGFTIQYSNNQTSVVDSEDGYTVLANAKKTFSFGAAARYYRVVYTNGAAAQTGSTFEIVTTLRYNSDKPSSHKVSEVIDDNTDAEMVKAVMTGRDEANNVYGNFSAVPLVNTTNTVYALPIIALGRPSLLSGRTALRLVVDSTVDVNVRTNTATKKVYITDIILTVTNTSAATTGRLNIRDSTTAGGGTLILPIQVDDPQTGESMTTVIQHTFAEPLLFNTAVYFDIVTGTLTVAGIMNGYEE